MVLGHYFAYFGGPGSLGCSRGSAARSCVPWSLVPTLGPSGAIGSGPNNSRQAPPVYSRGLDNYQYFGLIRVIHFEAMICWQLLRLKYLLGHKGVYVASTHPA